MPHPFEKYDYAHATYNDFLFGDIKVTPFREGDPNNDMALAVLRQRAAMQRGKHVIYDTLDDGDGWLLVGDDLDEMTHETMEHIDM